MAGWLDRLGSTLLDASLAATAITGLVVLAMIQCRQPARRQIWARAGLLSSLSVLPLAALNPSPKVDLRQPIASFLAVDVGDLALSSRDDTEARPTPPLVVPRILGQLGRALVFAYFSGVLLGLSGVALGVVGVVRLTSSGKVPSDQTLVVYESLAPSGKSSRPQLLVSERTVRPVLVGFFSPVILIPLELDQPCSSDRLRLVLLHELAHFENLDHRFSPIAVVAQAFWFFLPTSWWIRDQLRLDQEFLADLRAMDHFGTSGRYALALIEQATKIVDEHGHALDPTIPKRKAALADPVVRSALFQRVQMLVKCPFPIDRSTSLGWRWSTTLTLVLATFAASCLTIRGLGEWSESATAAFTLPETRPSLRIVDLVIEPRDPAQKPFELRYRLPDQFTLTLEIMAEPEELRLLGVLGHSLGRPAGEVPASDGYRLWHRVQIRRQAGFDFVEVDGQSLGGSPVLQNPTPWVTIRPFAGRPTRIRDLRIAPSDALEL